MNSSIPFINKLFSSKGFVKYLKNTSWLFGEQLFTMGVSFIIGALLARHLGTSGQGILSYGQSFGAFVIVIARFGLDSIVVRNLVNHPEDSYKYLGTAFFMKLASAAIGIIGLLLLLSSFSMYPLNQYVHHEPIKNWVIIIIALGTLFQSFYVIDFYYQSKVKARFAVRVRLIQFTISSMLKVLLIFYFEASVIWFAGIILLNEVLIALGFFIIYQYKEKALFKWSFDFEVAKKMAQDSWPLILSAFASIFYMKIDVMMITNMLGNDESGVYSIAVRLSEIWYVVPAVITNSLFPAIVSSKKQSATLYNDRVQSLYDLMVVIALFIILPITFLGSWLDDLIAFIYSEDFRQAAGVLRIQIWSSIFVFLGVASNYWLLTENLQYLGLYRILIGAVVNVILNYLLLPTMGIMGAAIATLISQAFASYLGYLVSKKTWIVFYMLTKSITLISLTNKVQTMLKTYR